MRIAVVIASTMRPVTLAETLSSLSNQIRPADTIVVSIVRSADLPEPLPENVKPVYSMPGLTKQRNEGVRSLTTDIDIIVFLDDDMILHRDYLKGIETIFSTTPDAALIMGHLIANGGVSIDQARKLIERPADPAKYVINERTFGGVYGCNMCVRSDVARIEPFDERLPLYSYMEDMDFGTRVRRHGHVGYYFGSLAVHLRVAEGRVSSRALGFSEIMNPVYLAAKGTIPPSHAVYSFVIRKPIANIVRMIVGPGRPQRWERLIGNFIALGHLFSWKLDPEHAEIIDCGHRTAS